MGRVRVGLVPKTKYEKRTPGLFKEEFRGHKMIALCSKWYIAMGSTVKTSAKGVNKRRRDSQGGRRNDHLCTKEERTFRLLR